MRAPSMQNVIVNDVSLSEVAPDIMQLPSGTLELIGEEICMVADSFYWLHVVMAGNVFLVMLRFFKAFQANPRLELVTNTLTSASNDILHFSIVATAVFVGFSVIGHILFGGDLVQFNSLPQSMNTAFISLMGDFGWYTEVMDSDLGLASGVPRTFVIMWFWLFMILNFLILLNMLMAIILDHYTKCFNEVKSDPDARAIWSQAWRYLKRLRRSQGHVPLAEITRMLEDESQPAHPAEKVTPDSLMEAFDMTKDQADFLIDWLTTEAHARQIYARSGEERLVARIKEVEGFMEGIAEILRIVSLNVHQCTSSLKDIEEKGNGTKEAVSPKKDTAPRPPRMDEQDAYGVVLENQVQHTEELLQLANRLREALPRHGMSESTTIESGSRTNTPPSSAFSKEFHNPLGGCCSVWRAQADAHQAIPVVPPTRPGI